MNSLFVQSAKAYYLTLDNNCSCDLTTVQYYLKQPKGIFWGWMTETNALENTRVFFSTCRHLAPPMERAHIASLRTRDLLVVPVDPEFYTESVVFS